MPVPRMRLTQSKKWVLFLGEKCYPLGGAEDLVGSYISMESALAAMRRHRPDFDSWAHIVDISNGRVRYYEARVPIERHTIGGHEAGTRRTGEPAMWEELEREADDPEDDDHATG
jgi:hypothetical protein